MAEQSEREKMLAGVLYDASDPQLAAARLRARQLTRRYNQSREDEGDLRASVLRELLGSMVTQVPIVPSNSRRSDTRRSPSSARDWL